MIVAAMYCLTILHPGALLGHCDAPAVEVLTLSLSAGSFVKGSEVGV